MDCGYFFYYYIYPFTHCSLKHIFNINLKSCNKRDTITTYELMKSNKLVIIILKQQDMILSIRLKKKK